MKAGVKSLVEGGAAIAVENATLRSARAAASARFGSRAEVLVLHLPGVVERVEGRVPH
jgi:hypothetical protein